MTAHDRVKLVNWNVEWARPDTRRGWWIQRKLELLDADIICLTEGYTDLLPGGGEIIIAEHNWQEAPPSGRYKVLLWSKCGWHNTATANTVHMPPGRFINGMTETPIGTLNVYGVCVPYHQYSYMDWLKQWEGNTAFLQSLKNDILPGLPQRSLVIGDFNQRIPRQGSWMQPQYVLDVLYDTFPDHLWQIPTAGENGDIPSRIKAGLNIPALDKPIIDHIIHSQDLQTMRLWRFDRYAEDGTRLSDHPGIYAEIREQV